MQHFLHKRKVFFSMNYVTSLGSVIIDRIERVHANGSIQAHEDLTLGGAGVFSLVGAILMAQSDVLLGGIGVGFSAKIGRNFPRHFHDYLSETLPRLQQPQTPIRIEFIDILEFDHPRAINTIQLSGRRDFHFETQETQYATNFRMKIAELSEPLLEETACFHMISSHERAMKMEEEIVQRRKSSAPPFHVFWEPSPGCCRESEFELFIKALASSHRIIASPNDYELKELVGGERFKAHPFSSNNFYVTSFSSLPLASFTESLHLLHVVRQEFLLTATKSCKLQIILRAAERGCLVMQDSQITILPAFWDVDNQDKVVDVTGAGNSFLGGAAVGYVSALEKNFTASSSFPSSLLQTPLIAAAIFGTVAASFTVQQVGIPRLEMIDSVVFWNDKESAQPHERLNLYLQRINYFS